MLCSVGKCVSFLLALRLKHCLLGCCAWLALGALSTCYAHQTGNSYLNIRQVDGHLAVDLDFYVRDLGNLLQKPGKESDPPPTADQLKSLQEPITEAIQKSLKLEIDEHLIPLAFTAQSVTVHNDGLYVRQHCWSCYGITCEVCRDSL